MEDLGIEQVVSRITRLNDRIRKFWSDTHGWAPREAANLLTKSRLDWQVSLSSSLHMWITQPDEANLFAVQILGYANLGSLVENTLKLFLSVYYHDYKKGIDAITRKGAIQDPDGVKLEPYGFSLRKIYGTKMMNGTHGLKKFSPVEMPSTLLRIGTLEHTLS